MFSQQTSVQLSPREKHTPSTTTHIDHHSGFDWSLKRNHEATELMKTGNYTAALRILHSAERFKSSNSTREQQLRKVIFNNLGCCYMKGQQWTLAARYLGSALMLEAEVERTPGILVNLSAVHYQLNDYHQALGQALKAIHILEVKSRSTQETRTYIKSFSSAAVAYEALGNRKMAVLHLYRGLEVASDSLGPSHDLTRSLKSRYEALLQSKDASFPSSRERISPKSDLFTHLPRRSFLRNESIFPLHSPHKILSSTPQKDSRLSPNYSSTAASSKDLLTPHLPKPPKKLRSMRLRATSEKQQTETLNHSKTDHSDVEARIHSIDEKLVNLTLRLSEYGWKNRELRQIAEKDDRISEELESLSGKRRENRKVKSVILIQSLVRGFLVRRRLKKEQTAAIEGVQSGRKARKLPGSSGKWRPRTLRYAMYNGH